MNKPIGWSWVFFLFLLFSSCAGEPPPAEEPAEEKVYEAMGTVVSIQEGRVTIDHDTIEGFMDAMTMSFPVQDPSLLEGLEPGTTVHFRLVVTDADFYIDRIEPQPPEH